MIFDDITYMWNLKTNDAISLLNKREMDLQIMVAKGEREGTCYSIQNRQSVRTYCGTQKTLLNIL